MQRLLSFLALSFLLACGGEPQPTDGLTKHVSLLVGEQGFAFDYKVFAVAAFAPFQEPFTGTLPESPLEGKADSCVVTSGEDTDPLAQFAFLAAPLGEAVSVGGPVTLSTSGTTYATLFERDFFGSPLYGSGPTEASITEPPLPASLTLGMPLQFYKNADGATLNPVARLEWLSPGQDDTVTPASTFAWTAAEGSALIGIQVTQANEARVADDLNVFCLARDDGSFTFPEATQTELEALEAGKLMQMGRLNVRYDAIEDTALLLASTSYLVFNLPQP